MQDPAILIITILSFHGRLINPPPDISVTSPEFSSREKCEAAADHYKSALESKRGGMEGVSVRTHCYLSLIHI